jgi:predicted membrane protein
VAVEYLAGLMGVPGGPSLAGGTNFAVGGATTGTGVLLAAACARLGKSCFGGLGRGLIAP